MDFILSFLIKNQHIFKKIVIHFLLAFFLTSVFFAINFYTVPDTAYWGYLKHEDNFLVLFGLSFLVTFIRTYTQQRNLIIFLFSLMAIEALHFSYFHYPILSFEIWDFFVSLVEVNEVLSTSTMLVQFVKIFLSFGFLIGLICWIFYITRNSVFRIPYIPVLFLLAFIIFSLSVFLEKRKIGLEIKSDRHLLRSAIEANTGFLGIVLPSKFSFFERSFPLVETPNPLRTTNLDYNIVLVLGESLNPRNMLSYSQPNNLNIPLNLSLANNKIEKKLSLSGSVCTFPSLTRFLNLLEYPTHYAQIVSEKTSIFKLAKQNGFQTTFITAQSSSSMGSIINNIGKKYIDILVTPAHISGKSYVNYMIFDEETLDLMQKKHAEDLRQFIVLHHSAAHEVYKERVPDHFQKSSDYGDTDYDLAVAYVEEILNKTIAILEKNNLPTYFIFTADHSEAQTEQVYGHCVFHPEVIVVPFFYGTFHMDKDPYLTTVQQAPNLVTHDYIARLVANLLGYDYPLEIENPYLINGRDEMGMDGILKVTTDGRQILYTEIISVDEIRVK